MSQNQKFKTEAFRDLLNEQHQWPCAYTFKFIVPQNREDQVEELFPGQEIDRKESAQGAYTSLTVTIQMECADTVIAVYEKAANIEGLISL